jgi:bacillithiol system protein YtxJ
MTEIKQMESVNDIEEALSRRCAVIFKHSTRCGISARAKRELDEFARTCENDTYLYLVNVIEDKDLSDEITKRTGIRHESPEAIFIHQGKITDVKTHFEITVEELERGAGTKHGVNRDI